MEPNGIFYPVALSLLAFPITGLATESSTDSAMLERERYLPITSGSNRYSPFVQGICY